MYAFIVVCHYMCCFINNGEDICKLYNCCPILLCGFRTINYCLKLLTRTTHLANFKFLKTVKESPDL